MAAQAELVKIPALAPYAHGLALFIGVGLILVASVLFGELLPKRIAILAPERLATRLALPMRIFALIAKPAAFVLSATCDGILRLLRMRSGDSGQVTEEEIRLLVAEGQEQGVIDESERRMVNRVLTLGDRTVANVMTPRTRITWLDSTLPTAENLETMRLKPYSRYPVLRGSDKDVLGVMEIKDLMAEAIAGGPVALFKRVHPPLFVPESAPALAVLESFREHSVPLALVVDEYGDIQGLVTPNDVLLSIMGRLGHAPETDEPKAVRRDDGSWLLDGGLSTDDVKELLGLAQLPLEDEHEFRSAAGLVIAQFGRIPAVGEHFDWRDWRFEVVDLDGARVDKILVTALERNDHD
jgi:putative hemolysin